MMQGLDIVTIKKIFADRKDQFSIDSQIKFEKIRYVREALNMINATYNRDGIEIQKITKDMKKYENIEVDMEYLYGKTLVKFNAQDFSVFAMPLNGGFFINHSEKLDSQVIININNYKGTIVLNGKFYITRVFIYDKVGNIVFENNVNINPAEPEIEILTEPDKNYQPKKSKKNIIKLYVKGFKLSDDDLYRQLFKNATVEVGNPEVFNDGIPNFLPGSIKSKILQIKRNRYEKNTVNHLIRTKMAVDYIFKMFQMDDIR